MANIFDLFKKIETAKTEVKPISFIIAGLGNIGKEYEGTRHNAGFIAIDHIAGACGLKIDTLKFSALISEAQIAGCRVLLMKPTTFMNNSGVAISEAAAFYKIPPENILVLADEISFDAGRIRIRRAGSAGGHNGLKSIISHIGSDKFPRIKIGIGNKPSPDYDLADYVLGRFTQAEREAIDGRLPDIAAATELIILGKIDEAMNRYSK